MNMFGFTMFTRTCIADELARRAGRRVEIGRLNWQADSFHIYGKDLAEAQQRLFDRLNATDFEDRVYHFSDPMIRELYEEAEAGVRRKIADHDRSRA